MTSSQNDKNLDPLRPYSNLLNFGSRFPLLKRSKLTQIQMELIIREGFANFASNINQI